MHTLALPSFCATARIPFLPPKMSSLNVLIGASGTNPNVLINRSSLTSVSAQRSSAIGPRSATHSFGSAEVTLPDAVIRVPSTK